MQSADKQGGEREPSRWRSPRVAGLRGPSRERPSVWQPNRRWRQSIRTVSSTVRSACTTPFVSGWRTITKPSPS